MTDDFATSVQALGVAIRSKFLRSTSICVAQRRQMGKSIPS